MNDEKPIYGKSYWEIVTHAYRKNWAARVALWISVLMIVVAILAPVLANDRPFTFVGTMPGEYEKAYGQVTRGAYMAMLTLPRRMANERRKFEEKKATLNDYLKRLTEEESGTQYDFLNRLRKRAESRPETRGPWISRDVPISDIEAELKLESEEYPVAIHALKRELSGATITGEQRKKKTDLAKELEAAVASIPGELAQIEAARQRISADMPHVYAQLLANALRGLRIKLSELADQLGDARWKAAAEIQAKFEQAVAGDYLTTTEDRKPAMQASLEEFKTAFDPTTVTLVSKRRWPLFASLHFLDIFFLVALALAALGFGPLTWWGPLRRILPLERRWTVTWYFALAPATLLSLVWLGQHESRFETVSYKQGVEEKSILMSSALWPPIRYRYDEVPVLTIITEEDRPPLKPSLKHPLGTDYMGRDLLSRMLWGSRVSLSIGFVAEAIALALGVILGALAGYYRGRVDMLLSRIIEIMICFPQFLLILAIVAFLPPSIYYVMLALGLFGWMGIARLQRGEFLRLVNLDFVQSAIALGASKSRVMFRHILPNALAPVLVAASFGIAGAMLTESALSFLGFGVQEPETSWGQILYTGRSQLNSWWTFVIPGGAIFAAVLCYNLVGDGIRDAVDPRLKS